MMIFGWPWDRIKEKILYTVSYLVGDRIRQVI